LIATAMPSACARRIEDVAAECFSRNARPASACGGVLRQASGDFGKTAAHRSLSVSAIQHCRTRMMG